MCGVLGIYGHNIQDIKTRVPQSLLTLAERGPDAQGIVERSTCLLAQTRLSIIDLAGGTQPMKDNREQIWVSFNGEIYNFLELKKILESLGHSFSTSSDTEVILKAYIEYGAKCVEKLDGMFAFILWDERSQTLLIARDRFGKKPLYFMKDTHNLYMASEIKALKALDIMPLTLNRSAIDAYLQLSYIPPTLSIYNEITTLLPAHYRLITPTTDTTTRYWSLEEKPLTVSYEQAKSDIKDLLHTAVKRRMIADVEIGSLLSGGVDSTFVSLLATEYSNHPLKTFSIKYGDSIDETPYAREASRKMNSKHYTLDASSKSIIEELKLIHTYMDEPLGDSSLFPQHIVSKLASQHVKVALTGDGADELFMGYGWYTKWNNLSKKEWLKTRLFSNQYQEYIKYITVFTDAERNTLWKDKQNHKLDIHQDTKRLSSIKKINRFDLTTYLPGQLLTKIDRTSMMHSLEVRSPFLDTALAEYVYNLPTEFKMKGNQNKIILKDMLSEYMPADFVYRRKQGFGAPISHWLSQPEVKSYVEDMSMPDSPLGALFDLEYIKLLTTKFYNGDNSLAQKVWGLLNLFIWLNIHQRI